MNLTKDPNGASESQEKETTRKHGQIPHQTAKTAPLIPPCRSTPTKYARKFERRHIGHGQTDRFAIKIKNNSLGDGRCEIPHKDIRSQVLFRRVYKTTLLFRDESTWLCGDLLLFRL